ncbi:trigger factor [Clostridium pasteurianum DSM 525 = ATCC 6013]|uniref:Trigger factor n=1 Tax=Clostridium pasteurianum DSM 525 = ATCC 6013 TaxID=1262449 RepID=A0A0H3J481_CLOPA|nr:trigger factor [Clostridium pasteurianum]AJA48746.1 trigger factor [Clostridium pasteurianum DSM 525 = ATCC 6013]AJA52734.1 trigger factor [Clostridium pasteurianum DSM 525 = ATCC 6013]AOZ75969.1 trigger factor [Clostridium pasteurianum DSM 525 = ATCC 6013]AOZ79765.1 trigger factor [Clostridium pasteurianum]ELP60045.1 trigger factor [Clostridium pasteurianum DSM 525 = ATCC 6013]
MNAKMEKVENNVVKLEITVEAEKFNEAVQKAYKKNSKKFNVPGFRKGKAPLSIIKKYYGEGVFYEDAINFCCDDTYPIALKENDINPVDYPEIDIVEIGEGKDLVYTAKVTVTPEVELGEYEGVEVKKVEYPVTEEDIDNELKATQEKNARIETKEENEAVEKGNIAVIDFKGSVDGVAFEGGEATDYSLEIGSGAFIDNFEDQLIGLKKGETKDVEVTFPEEYGKEELNGKKAVFNVTIKEIKIKELPEIDDEFVKEVSEFDTLEELKNDIKTKKEESNNEKAKAEYEDHVVDAVCDNAKVDIPEVMIKNETDQMIKELEMKLKYQGLDLDSYYKFTNSSEEKVRDYMKETAEKRVKTRLVIEKIAAVTEIKPTEEELLEKATEAAKQYGTKDVEKMAKVLLDAQRPMLEQDLTNGKVIDLLVEKSKAID